MNDTSNENVGPAAPTGYRSALSALKAAQKPSKGTAAYSRLVNRPLGRVVAAAASTIGVTPNQATAISASLSALGIFLLATRPPSWPMACAVAFLLAAGYVMDSVDGQLSRLRGGGSRSGEWLDHTVDCFKTATLHLAVLISLYRFPVVSSDWALAVPLMFEIVAVVMFFGLILVPTLRPARPSQPIGSTPSQAENPLRKWLLLPIDYGFLCLIFVFRGMPTVFLLVYGLVFLASAAALVAALAKWWHELKALDRVSV